MGDHFNRAVPDAVENRDVAASEDGHGGEHGVGVFCTDTRRERLHRSLESDRILIRRVALCSLWDWLFGHDLVTSRLAISADFIAKTFTGIRASLLVHGRRPPSTPSRI
ncbi:hypothetical protein [Ralstonia mojiangensis]|uniref:hypothetical protein n=1 Tax=Ralstonia mojiangensis TaxID=2953895 RepID=UPI00209006F2|nr:hypothetical protein [Ralstonia mojiangensis]MCO5413497.1 hypothetical protein [Ralstonia mojiangensis]